MTVCVIDYGAGNLHSVLNALDYIDKPKGLEVRLADSASQLEAASHIILPGVGSFAGCMEGLQALPGMIEALKRKVLTEKLPFLGICVGMQMLFESSEEHGEHPGLGWIKGKVQKIEAQQGLRVPHMGWNELELQQPNHPCLAGISNKDHAYFVHSYHCVPKEKDVIAATVEYGGARVAAVSQANLFASQFHPEKSQRTGLRLLQNFLQQQQL